VIRAGQSRAVSEGVSVVLWIDEAKSQYGIELETPDQKGDPKPHSFTADENVQLAVVQTGAGTPTTFNELPAIRFLADGSVDENSPATLQLTDAAGGRLWLIEATDRRNYEIRDSDQK